jgi:hypothetical protein
MVYLMMLSVTWTIQHQKIELLVNNELERMWKEVVAGLISRFRMATARRG